MVSRTRSAVTTHGDALQTLARRMRAEYAEMPGLSVTLPQAQRLLGVDGQTCAAVLGTLVDRGVLKRTKRGQFVRASA